MENVERYISVFDKNGDFFFEVNVDKIELAVLKQIFPPYEDDPYFIMLYQIGEKEALEIKKHFDLEFDFANFQYELSTYEKVWDLNID